MLQISVWGNPELNVHLPVRPDGMISMPLMGDVKAAGTTPHELKVKLEKELVRFVKAPVVSVMVTAINSFKVYIFGDGASKAMSSGGAAANAAGGGGATSGQMTLRRNTTLLQLLAQVGSLSDVDVKNAYLLRAGKRLDVNFENLIADGDVSQDVKLESNDVIYLPAGFNSRIRVTGEVRAPGVFPYAGGMTALDAVLIAGGFTEFASQNDVIIETGRQRRQEHPRKVKGRHERQYLKKRASETRRYCYRQDGAVLSVMRHALCALRLRRHS